tara:strand:- start:16 stop:678 length:663 start_codon:yes stop_codon:yes gene_type:complete
MALNKLKFNSINVTPAASKAIRFNSSANGLETASGGGNLIKIASSTASSSSSISFTSGINSTHKEYIFFFNNIHPSTNGTNFTFNMSVDSGSNYNVSKTTSLFNAFHYESGSSSNLAYIANVDLAQSADYQPLMSFGDLNNSNDGGLSGYLHLFEPSNTTFVKHFIARTSLVGGADGANQYVNNDHIGGHANTTSAVDALDFKMSSGNIDAGTITMYGVL